MRQWKVGWFRTTTGGGVSEPYPAQNRRSTWITLTRSEHGKTGKTRTISLIGPSTPSWSFSGHDQGRLAWLLPASGRESLRGRNLRKNSRSVVSNWRLSVDLGRPFALSGAERFGVYREKLKACIAYARRSSRNIRAKSGIEVRFGRRQPEDDGCYEFTQHSSGANGQRHAWKAADKIPSRSQQPRASEPDKRRFAI